MGRMVDVLLRRHDSGSLRAGYGEMVAMVDEGPGFTSRRGPHLWEEVQRLHVFISAYISKSQLQMIYGQSLQNKRLRNQVELS